ncbi:MAG: hypothetical protein PVF05_03360 [Gemmatimonadales bacterium]|jgi:hypothetical protein
MNVAIAELIAMVTSILIVGLLLVSIPITRRLGRALEVWIKVRAEGAADSAQVDGLREEVRALARHVEALDDRLQLVSERQDFTESLVERRDERTALPPGGG